MRIARDFDESRSNFDANKVEVDYNLRSNAIAGRLAPNSDSFKDVAAELINPKA